MARITEITDSISVFANGSQIAEISPEKVRMIERDSVGNKYIYSFKKKEKIS